MIRDSDTLRTVWLFGKPYFWARLPGGRLVLARALPPVEQPVTSLDEAVMTMFAGPLPGWPPKEESGA